jgi:hypothetical protein
MVFPITAELNIVEPFETFDAERGGTIACHPFHADA